MEAVGEKGLWVNFHTSQFAQNGLIPAGSQQPEKVPVLHFDAEGETQKKPPGRIDAITDAVTQHGPILTESQTEFVPEIRKPLVPVSPLQQDVFDEIEFESKNLMLPDLTKDARFHLLVFGEQAETKIWLIIDGEMVYIDRDGDGNLTESGESIRGLSGRWFEDVSIAVSGDWYDSTGDVSYPPGEKFKIEIHHDPGNKTAYTVQVLIADHIYQAAVLTHGAKLAKDALVLHFDGPLQAYLFGNVNEIERTVGEKESLFIEIGTVSPTGRAAHVYSIPGELPDGLRGTANFEFTSANGKKIEQASPLQPRFPESSEVGGFRLDFEIPDGMDGGDVRIYIEFDSKNIIQIPPYEVTLPIRDDSVREEKS